MVLRPAALHLFDNLCVHVGYVRFVIVCRPALNTFGERHFQVHCGFAALGRVDFIDNYGEGLAFEFADGVRDNAELLNRRDDDVFAGFEKTLELRRGLIDGVHHAGNRSICFMVA